MGETSWTFLVLGSLGAFGAAMAAGTLVALLRYRRTGRPPGSDEVVELSRGRLVSLWLRVVVGIAVAAAGIVALSSAGLI